jgi:CRISPR-associated endonuclease Cas2
MIIVSYDFANDKTRAKFSKFLKKYGRRLQYSVFELKNSQRILDNVLKEVEIRYKLSFTNSDSVLIYNMCRACDDKVVRYGFSANEETPVLIFE